MNFHLPCLESTSLSSYILTNAEITAAYVLTQKSYLYVKTSTAHHFKGQRGPSVFFFKFFFF